MITESFDLSAPMIGPEHFYKKIDEQLDILIATFSHDVIEKVALEYNLEIVAYFSSANGKSPIYKFKDEEKSIGIYMTMVGAPSAGAMIEEIAYMTGAKKFLFFGSCGSLDEEITGGKIIVPTYAYRDEGMSYHYAKAEDFIEVKNSEKVYDIISTLGIPCVKGKTWTTDAFFMETVNKVKKRRDEGCICVEMECSALQAVCNYRGYELYQFLFAGDILAIDHYDVSHLTGENHKNNQVNCFELALEMAKLL